MPSNVNSLLIAWATCLIVIVGGVLLLEATYDPNAAQQTEETTELADASEDDASQADTDADLANSDEPQPVANSSSADSALPAPGQTETSQPSTIEGATATLAPEGIPVNAVPDLLEQSQLGLLPQLAADGRQSFNVYAAPIIQDRTKARIAILVTELAKRARNTQRAIDDLPPNVSLAFSVYGTNLHEWGRKAREKGHEVFLSVPMEPVSTSQRDPGPLALLTGQSTRTKVQMLRSSLARFSGYVGIVNHMGGRFTAAADSIGPVLDELKRRGLMFVDNRESKYSRGASMAQGINMPWAVNNGYIDADLDSEAITLQLTELEKRARTQGTALGMARPLPITIRTLNVWAATLEERGFVLVPVTSIAGQQALPR